MNCSGPGVIYDAITSHDSAYVNNSGQNRYRAVCEELLWVSCYDATADMQYDLLGAFIKSGHLIRL